MTWWAPHLIPHTPLTHSQTGISYISPDFPWQSPRCQHPSHYLMELQEQLNRNSSRWYLWGGTQKKRNPHFVPSQSKCAIVWGLPAEPLAPVGPEGLLTWQELQVPVPFVWKGLGSPHALPHLGVQPFPCHHPPAAPTAAAPWATGTGCFPQPWSHFSWQSPWELPNHVPFGSSV